MFKKEEIKNTTGINSTVKSSNRNISKEVTETPNQITKKEVTETPKQITKKENNINVAVKDEKPLIEEFDVKPIVKNFNNDRLFNEFVENPVKFASLFNKDVDDLGKFAKNLGVGENSPEILSMIHNVSQSNEMFKNALLFDTTSKVGKVLSSVDEVRNSVGEFFALHGTLTRATAMSVLYGVLASLGVPYIGGIGLTISAIDILTEVGLKYFGNENYNKIANEKVQKEDIIKVAGIAVGSYVIGSKLAPKMKNILKVGAGVGVGNTLLKNNKSMLNHGEVYRIPKQDKNNKKTITQTINSTAPRKNYVEKVKDNKYNNEDVNDLKKLIASSHVANEKSFITDGRNQLHTSKSQYMDDLSYKNLTSSMSGEAKSYVGNYGYFLTPDTKNLITPSDIIKSNSIFEGGYTSPLSSKNLPIYKMGEHTTPAFKINSEEMVEGGLGILLRNSNTDIGWGKINFSKEENITKNTNEVVKEKPKSIFQKLMPKSKEVIVSEDKENVKIDTNIYSNLDKDSPLAFHLENFLYKNIDSEGDLLIYRTREDGEVELHSNLMKFSELNEVGNRITKTTPLLYNLTSSNTIHYAYDPFSKNSSRAFTYTKVNHFTKEKENIISWENSKKTTPPFWGREDEEIIKYLNVIKETNEFKATSQIFKSSNWDYIYEDAKTALNKILNEKDKAKLKSSSYNKYLKFLSNSDIRDRIAIGDKSLIKSFAFKIHNYLTLSGKTITNPLLIDPLSSAIIYKSSDFEDFLVRYLINKVSSRISLPQLQLFSGEKTRRGKSVDSENKTGVISDEDPTNGKKLNLSSMIQSSDNKPSVLSSGGKYSSATITTLGLMSESLNDMTILQNLLNTTNGYFKLPTLKNKT